MEGVKKLIKVAILDLYEGVENQGMRCIREILNQYAEANQLDLQWDEFEVRIRQSVPDLSYDLYISSGGPGSPLESEGSEWEKVYFDWLSSIEDYNNKASENCKKFVFFICHSYQLACRHYKVGKVAKRNSTAFGVFPIHMLPGAQKERAHRNFWAHGRRRQAPRQQEIVAATRRSLSNVFDFERHRRQPHRGQRLRRRAADRTER